MSSARPLVSVCIVTYQHVRFISQAIEGALMQQTHFPVEILIGEDESTDGTRELCLDYERRHPDRVRVLLHRREDVVMIDGQPRGGANLRATVRSATGEFIALCEGDDYWTDSEKLQRQIDFMRANPDCVGCFHDTTLIDAAGVVTQPSYFHSTKEKFNQFDVLESLMSNYPTCSLLFRRAAFDPLPDWFLRRPCDLYLDIHLTSQGNLGFINRNMGAYRKHLGGVWGGQRESNQIIELIIRYKLLLADSFFLSKYRDLLVRKIDELQAALFTRRDGAIEIERLEKLVQKQTEAVELTQIECARLAKETTLAQSEIDRVRIDYQKNIDELLRQLDKLTTLSRQHTEYISNLEKERDRITALAESLEKDTTHYVKVIAEQDNYIKILKSGQSGARA